MNKPTRIIITLMIILFLTGVFIAKWYYGRQNKAVDPRVVPARLLYEKYNEYARQHNFKAVFELMDSIESIYSRYPHYRDSYEVGVLHNNRAAALLTISLFKDSLDIPSSFTVPFMLLEKDTLLAIALSRVNQSLSIYQNWLKRYNNKTEEELLTEMEKDFLVNLTMLDDIDLLKIKNNRAKEIQDACLETRRRLSVAYTNKGIIYRHQEEYERAAKCYKIALEYWDENLTAENNLNVLLNKPKRKRNFIQKLFPADKQ